MGPRQPDRSARVLRRGQALRRNACSSTTTASTASKSRSRAFSTPMGRACARMTAALSRTSSCRRCGTSRSPFMAMAARLVRSATSSDLVDGLIKLMEVSGRGNRADQPRQPGRIHNPGTGQHGAAADGLTLRDCASTVAAGRPAAAPPRHQRGTPAAWLCAVGATGEAPHTQVQFFGRADSVSGEIHHLPRRTKPDMARPLRPVAARHQHHIPILDHNSLVERTIIRVDALQGIALRRLHTVVVGFLEKRSPAARRGRACAADSSTSVRQA